MSTENQVYAQREYETIYVLRPDSTREVSETVANRISEVIGREGGKLTLVENWGRRKMAYAVKRNTRGVYVYLKFVAPGKLVAELERNLRLLDSVLKFQTIKLRDDVVDPNEIEAVGVEFEHFDPSQVEEEVEATYSEILGLVPREGGGDHYASSRNSDDDDDDDDMDMSDDGEDE